MGRTKHLKLSLIHSDLSGSWVREEAYMELRNTLASILLLAQRNDSPAHVLLKEVAKLASKALRSVR